MYVANRDGNTASVINFSPRPEIQQQGLNNNSMTTAQNNNNIDTMIKNIISQLANDQKIQKSKVMSPISLPTNKIQTENFN